MLKPDLEAATAAAASVSPEASAKLAQNSTGLSSGLLHQSRVQPDLFLLDFGLTAAIPEEDKPKLVVAVVHMANKDWAAVTEDFVALRFLPDDIDRLSVTPLLQRVLSPYVLNGGGAKGYLKEGVFSPSFQNLMRDLSAAAVKIPFSKSVRGRCVRMRVTYFAGIP
jgi:predicted unusual protein kinase regulating ubiquinone biosynthesis (AarF/ABC1/UbiB family)